MTVGSDREPVPGGGQPPPGAGQPPPGDDRPAPGDDRRRPLVIGYGNMLRSDDGVGWHVALTIVDDPRAAAIDVVAAHQLTPELAEDMHRAASVVLVDAAIDGDPPPAPGRCVVHRLDPDLAAAGFGAGTHHCTPLTLATLATRLYGSVCPVTVVGVGIASVDEGVTLTPPVAAALPGIVDLVLDLAGAGAGAGDAAGTPGRRCP